MTTGAHEHWRGNSSGDLFIKAWTNTAKTKRTSHNHGAGSQTFIVLGNGAISGVSKGCEYVG